MSKKIERWAAMQYIHNEQMSEVGSEPVEGWDGIRGGQEDCSNRVPGSELAEKYYTKNLNQRESRRNDII